MSILIITLIIVFGCVLTALGVHIVRGLGRVEREIALNRATLDALIAAADLEPEAIPEQARRRPVLTVIKGGLAPVIALLALGRRHWMRTVTGAAGAATATLVGLSLALGHSPTAPAGPPQAAAPPTTALAASTSATLPRAPTPAATGSATAPPAPRTAPKTTAPTSAPVHAARATQSAAVAVQVSVRVTLPAVSASLPVQSTTLIPQPSQSGPACLIAVNAQPILAVCVP